MAGGVLILALLLLCHPNDGTAAIIWTIEIYVGLCVCHIFLNTPMFVLYAQKKNKKATQYVPPSLR